MSKSSLLKSLLSGIFKWKSNQAPIFKGSDLTGNKYFEIPLTSDITNKSKKSRRYIEREDKYNYGLFGLALFSLLLINNV